MFSHSTETHFALLIAESKLIFSLPHQDTELPLIFDPAFLDSLLGMSSVRGCADFQLRVKGYGM